MIVSLNTLLIIASVLIDCRAARHGRRGRGQNGHIQIYIHCYARSKTIRYT